MRLFDIIRISAPEITAEESKLHIATWNGSENPLDYFFEGGFEGWQSWQGRKNFERSFIVSLIQLPGLHRWLLAGCYRRLGRSWVTDPGPPHWSYQTEEVQETTALSGRVVVSFRRSGRAAYLNADRWEKDLMVVEVLPRRMSVGDFPGYHRFVLSKYALDLIVLQEVATWRGALQAVAGVYLITDTVTGKLYVGSATGEGGIWARWCGYHRNGHGGNKELRAILKEEGEDYAAYWQWSVLEIADTHTSADEVLQREAHWKRVLCSRKHGYNAN